MKTHRIKEMVQETYYLCIRIKTNNIFSDQTKFDLIENNEKLYFMLNWYQEYRNHLF